MTEQEAADDFYKKNGPCCAGCDHWQRLNSVAGLCAKSRLVSGSDRVGPLGIDGLSLSIGAGLAMTPRAFSCANFVDTFDWPAPPHP